MQKREDGSCSIGIQSKIGVGAQTLTVVKLTIDAQLTLAEFTSKKQDIFANAIAAAAGVENKFVDITKVQLIVAIRRRRLQSEGISISTQITAQDEAEAASIVNSMTTSNINTYMTSFGVTVTVSTSAITEVTQVQVSGQVSGGPKSTHDPLRWVYAAVLYTACMLAMR